MEIYKNSGNRILFGIVTGALIIAIAIYLGLQSDQAEAPAMQGEADINKWEDAKEDVISRLTKLEGGTAKHGAKLDELNDTSSQDKKVKSLLQLHPSINEYHASVIQVGGVGSHLLTKGAWACGDSNCGNISTEKYVPIGLTRGGDSIIAFCFEGFHLTQCTSPSGSPTSLYNDDGCRIHLEKFIEDEHGGGYYEDKLKNSLQLTCERK